MRQMRRIGRRIAIRRTERGAAGKGRIAAVGILGLMALCCSCTTTRTVTRETPVVTERVTRDTVAVTRWRTDTVRERDSVVVTQQGIDRWHTRYVMRTRVDTIMRSRTDTVPCVVTVSKETVRETPRRAKWWERTLMWIGGLSLVGGVLSVALVAGKR